MSKPVIAKLSASVDLGNGVENVDINIGINTTATATLQLGQKTEQVVVRPLAADILKQIKEMQAKRLAGVSEPDVNLEVNDFLYGTMSMQGYVASPMLEISDGNVGFQLNVLDKASMLDGLDLSIYEHAFAPMRAAIRADGFPKPTGDVTKLLLEWTDLLVQQYDTALLKEYDPVKKRIIQMRHELNNSGPLQIWRKILTDSKVVHKSWKSVIDLHGGASTHISDKIRTMLCTKSSGFWNVVNMIMSAFQMYYKPDPGGSGYGEFRSNFDKMGDPKGTLELDIVNLNVRDGSARILQVGGVIIESGGAKGFFREDQRAASAPSCAGVYPDPVKKGYIHVDIPPIWLVDASGMPILGSAVDEKKSVEPGTDAPNLSLEEYQSRREKGVKQLEKSEKGRSAVMTEMCEYTFKDLQLQDSALSARLPLNLTIQVGERQNIKLGDSGTVKGFIQAVRHSIDLRQGKELDSFSQVTISHVEY